MSLGKEWMLNAEIARNMYYEAPGLEEKLLFQKVQLQSQIAYLQRELGEAVLESMKEKRRADAAEARLRVIEREGL